MFEQYRLILNIVRVVIVDWGVRMPLCAAYGFDDKFCLDEMTKMTQTNRRIYVHQDYEPQQNQGGCRLELHFDVIPRVSLQLNSSILRLQDRCTCVTEIEIGQHCSDASVVAWNAIHKTLEVQASALRNMQRPLQLSTARIGVPIKLLLAFVCSADRVIICCGTDDAGCKNAFALKLCMSADVLGLFFSERVVSLLLQTPVKMGVAPLDTLAIYNQTPTTRVCSYLTQTLAFTLAHTYAMALIGMIAPMDTAPGEFDARCRSWEYNLVEDQTRLLIQSLLPKRSHLQRIQKAWRKHSIQKMWALRFPLAVPRLNRIHDDDMHTRVRGFGMLKTLAFMGKGLRLPRGVMRLEDFISAHRVYHIKTNYDDMVDNPNCTLESSWENGYQRGALNDIFPQHDGFLLNLSIMNTIVNMCSRTAAYHTAHPHQVYVETATWIICAGCHFTSISFDTASMCVQFANSLGSEPIWAESHGNSLEWTTKLGLPERMFCPLGAFSVSDIEGLSQSFLGTMHAYIMWCYDRAPELLTTHALAGLNRVTRPPCTQRYRRKEGPSQTCFAPANLYGFLTTFVSRTPGFDVDKQGANSDVIVVQDVLTRATAWARFETLRCVDHCCSQTTWAPHLIPNAYDATLPTDNPSWNEHRAALACFELMFEPVAVLFDYGIRCAADVLYVMTEQIYHAQSVQTKTWSSATQCALKLFWSIAKSPPPSYSPLPPDASEEETLQHRWKIAARDATADGSAEQVMIGVIKQCMREQQCDLNVNVSFEHMKCLVSPAQLVNTRYLQTPGEMMDKFSVRTECGKLQVEGSDNTCGSWCQLLTYGNMYAVYLQYLEKWKVKLDRQDGRKVTAYAAAMRPHIQGPANFWQSFIKSTKQQREFEWKKEYVPYLPGRTLDADSGKSCAHGISHFVRNVQKAMLVADLMPI
jgi:hypothetical protein